MRTDGPGVDNPGAVALSQRGRMSLYNPLDPGYLDPVAARAERDRTFQACSDCRICVRLCPSFRSLFEMVDANDDGADDVTVLTDREHRARRRRVLPVQALLRRVPVRARA